MTSRLHTQYALSLDLSSPAIHGTTEEEQGQMQSAVAKQLIPCPHRLFQSKLFLVIGCVLAVMILKGLPCLAQAEIDPDHYESINSEPISPDGQKAVDNRHTDRFRGGFTLPFNVKCGGLTLRQGSYSFSIDSQGKWRAVTFIPRGEAPKFQTVYARGISRSHRDGSSALVLERAGQQHTLTAIRLEDREITLDLQAEEGTSVSADTELVPIFYTRREPSEN